MKTTTLITKNEKGQAVIMAAFALFAILAVLGLAIDLGRFVVVRAELSKAVDGAALAGARVLPTGRSNAQKAAYEYAQMNFADDYMSTASHRFSVRFDPDPTHARIGVTGAADMPSMFLKLVGIHHTTVTAFAEAERRPLSVALVLDNTESLSKGFSGTDAIGYLRTAAGKFVRFFDDDMDQMALVLFSTGTELRFPLGHDFTSSMTATTGSMAAVAFTNLSDGLIAGRNELQNDPNRASFRALVFFTDGRATALRDVFRVGGVPTDAVITGKQDPVSGHVWEQLYQFHRLDEKINGLHYTAPVFPNGSDKTVVNLQSQANQNLRQAAALARREGITIFTIGLGNPSAHEAWKQPDAELLIQIANAPDGIDPRTGGVLANPIYDPNQPKGGFFFAPDATQLDSVFEQVARQIVLRLTQ
jgi:Flp pilus assembly protein TadG